MLCHPLDDVLPSTSLLCLDLTAQVLGEVGEEELEHYGEVEEVSPEQKERENAEKRRALYDIMSCMRDIRKRTERTDMMFEPLKVCMGCCKSMPW
jgi:hypothetical protein